MKFISSILFVFILQNAYSQNNFVGDTLSLNIKKQIAFSHLSIENGLSQNSIISIAQDSIGYMWFATQDGLNKYNGRSFKIYNKQFEDITRPTFSRLGKIYIDKKNKLWIITNSGNLEFYESKTDRFIAVKQFKDVSAIFQDKKHNTYIGTYGKGLFKIDATTKDTLQLFKTEDVDKTIYDFHQYNEDIIVASSGAVFLLNNNNTYHNIIKNDKAINYSSIAQSPNGTLWVGSYGKGLFYKEKESAVLKPFKKIGFLNFPENLNIEDLLIDNKNRLWVATYGHGAYILDFNQQKLTNFIENKTNPFAIRYNDMLSLYQDNTGIIWLGSDGAGASYYDEHLVKFNVLTNKQMPKSVNIDVVRSISTDTQGNTWIGTSGKGLACINNDKNSFKTISTNNSALASNRIISLNHSNKSLWIGHQGYGLNILEPSGHYKYYSNISNFTIWGMLTETKQRTWLCTEKNGLILFDKNEGIIERYNTKNSALTTNNIKTIIKGNENEFWIGTENSGVFKFSKLTNKITKLNNVNDPIKSLFFKDDILWIGTAGKGLKRYNTKSNNLLTYTKENGLPNNVIYGILPDNENNLWLSSNIGLTKFSLRKETETPIIENYNNYDGLQALEFNTGAYFKSQDGTLYFGGLEGINWFHPNQLTFNSVKPKTIISNFEIFTKAQPLIQNQDFNYDQNTVTFTFSSLHFSQPDRNLYKYQLVNHDNDWIESNNINKAHYTNLPPNDYEFQVISCNYDGLWNEEPALYKFTIKQPWYNNTLAKLVYLCLLLLTAYTIYKYLKWRWGIKLQLELEHTETTRLKELDEFKTKLYTNISHEFRTPLTLILSPTENQLSKKNISADDKNDLSLIQRNAKRLLNLVNQLLDLSRLETGHLKLHIEKDDLSILIKQIVSSFKYKAKEKEIIFKDKVLTISNAWFDKDIVEKIVTNLLANAIKYTPPKGKIYFNAEQQNNTAIITVINSGSSIKPENLNKLFTRFYQVNSHADGVGIGLALVKELVALTNGSLVANTMDSNKIQFTVTLPINKLAFSEKHIHITHKETNENDTLSVTDNTTSNIEKNTEKPVVLIAEDDKHVRLYMESILKNDYKILKASNGKIGIKKALANIPDLIISDIMMPITDGIELCNTLKNDMLTSHIPIILLTAKVGEENELKGLEVGADDFITKPFQSKILFKRIANLISSRKSLQLRYNQHTSLKSKDIAISSIDEDFLRNAKVIFDKHLSKPEFNAELFSKKMLMSRMQLHRKINALTGLSTSNFIRSQRLKLAAQLLQKSDYTIAEIAYQVGFNTPSYFIKCFKETYHCTPNDYVPKH